MNLYYVLCAGMHDGHGSAYVVADNPTKAYEIVRADLDKRDLGFANERTLRIVSLLAEDVEYPPCGRRLYLPAALEAKHGD